MPRRKWKQLGSDLDTALVEVWTGQQITFKRSMIFFREMFKALKGGRQSWFELEHQQLQERLKNLKCTHQSDGNIYTSNPPQNKCTICGEFYR